MAPAYAGHKTNSEEAGGRKTLQWPSHQTSSTIAHRSGNLLTSVHRPNYSTQQAPQVPKLPMTSPFRAPSGRAKSGVAPGYAVPRTARQSPKHRDDGWDEQQSLLNILSQPSPQRPWSAGGFTGRPELDSTATVSQMMPGTIGWTSPRNHIGVHPESLLYNRDPEQLAADVIGLSERYTALANEHKLQKVQISKLSSSLSRERAEAAELSEVADLVGMLSPRNRAGSPGSRAGSRPGSPGRAFRNPCRPQSRPTSARVAGERSGGSMPEWVLTDLQQRLNAAQQLLDNRSMGHNQGHLAETWPRARPRSPAGKGIRPGSSHISLDPNSRLADAFAIYGVPRGITQYMSRKWTQPSTRGNVVNLAPPMRRRSSSLISQQQLQEKVAAVRKASHVILLEVMQLRAHFPPAVSAEEHEAIGPHLEALINLLHNHSLQVQDELRMLPGFNASQMPQTSSLSQQRNYSSSSRPAGPSLYPPSHAPPRGSDPKQDSPFLPSDNEEDNSFIAADDDPADESAAAAVDDNADESAVEAAAEAARDLTTSCEEEAEQITAAGGESTASGEEAAEHGDIPQKLSAEEDLGMHAQSPERQSAGAMTKAAEAMTKAAEAMTEASKSQVQSVPAGSGIPDEYLRRVHMSTKTPLQTPSPTRTPHGTPPASISMPRQWTKTNSYPDGSKGSQKGWETGHGGSFKGPKPDAPVDVMTYDHSSSGHVPPVGAESARAAFNDACGDSFHRREDVLHPAMHIAKSGESSSAAPQLKVSQQQPSRVIDDTKNELEPLRKAPSRQLSTADSAASQVAASDRQLSASLSSTCKVAELAQGQPEADLAEEEADLEPKHALSARQESESAEDDDYADEFESDELVAQPKSITMPPHKLYHNPLGGDESAEEAEQWDTQGSQLHHVAVSDNSLEEEDQPQAYGDDVAGSHMHSPAEVPHVKTQLRVAEGDSVKVQWSLNVSKDQPEDEDEEDDDQGRSSFSKMPPTPYPKRSIFSATADDDLLEDEHMRPCDASACVPHVKTQLSLSEEGEPMKVQWRLDVSKPEGGDDEEEGQDEGKGRFSKMPSTPFPRRSIFSASGNMADDVDIFSTTLPAEDSGSESAAESDFGGSLPRVSSDVRQDSAGESGMQLTPSYRQTQGRSLQQAADNEQPFATSWRPRPGPAQEADAVTPNLAPTRISMSQTPSRRSSLVQSQDTAAGEVTQSSLSTAGTSVHAKPAGSNEAAPAVVPSTLPSHASLPVQVSLNTPASVSSLSRQPSYVPGPASGVSSRRSSFSARVERETSQLLGSRQVSNAASMNAAEQPSQGASRTASLSSGANAQLGPVLSSRVLTPQAAAASEADRKVAKRSSFSKPASLSRETSGISRQASGGKSSAAVTAPIAASSRTASRQPSFSNPAALSRQPSQDSRQSSIMSTAGAEVPSPAASSVVSRQASQTQPAALSSRQASHISRQPSSAAGGLAPSKEGARQTSVDRPASAARQNSQRQVGRDDAMVPQSESTVSSRQQSLAARSLSGLQDADAHDLPAPGQLSSQSSMDSMSSQPHRSNSLEAMHQQMGMLGNRKPTAVGSVAPAAVGRKLSQEGLGSFKSTESRRPSFANELHRLTPHTGLQEMKQAENDVDVVSDDNSSMHGERHFESSYDRDSRNAAEKHAYLHSQHGIDDSVF